MLYACLPVVIHYLIKPNHVLGVTYFYTINQLQSNFTLDVASLDNYFGNHYQLSSNHLKPNG